MLDVKATEEDQMMVQSTWSDGDKLLSFGKKSCKSPLTTLSAEED